MATGLLPRLPSEGGRRISRHRNRREPGFITTRRRALAGYGLVASFPAGTFYDDLNFTTTFRNDPAYVSHVYTVGDPTVPLSGSYDMTIDLTRDDQSDKSKYCVVRIAGKRQSAVTTSYSDGKVSCRPNNWATMRWRLTLWLLW